MNPAPLVALVGNPNAGKSALFNALTGARQKIANYPGVTVERKAGRMILPSGEPVELIDLPGSNGLSRHCQGNCKHGGQRISTAQLVSHTQDNPRINNNLQRRSY